MRFNRVALVSAALVLCGTAGYAMQATTSRTVLEGIYTEGQAARGENVFKNNCSSCHYQTEFKSADFISTWSGKPLFELFSMISDSMPEDRPGTLPPQQYADTITYFLKLNNYPTGGTELEGSVDAMKDILMEKVK